MMNQYQQAFTQIGEKLQQQGAGFYHRYAAEQIPEQVGTSEEKFRLYLINLIEKFQEHSRYSHSEIVEDFNDIFNDPGQIEQLVDGVNGRPFDGHTIKESLIVKHLVGTYRQFYSDDYFEDVVLEDRRTPLERIADREGGIPVDSESWPLKQILLIGLGAAALGYAGYEWFRS